MPSVSVLSKTQLLGRLVWFSVVNDADLLDEDQILTEQMCAPNDRAKVREAARLVDSLLKNYSYVRSPEFAMQIREKSKEFVRMRTRLTDEPAKRPEQRRRAEEALAASLISDAAYDLFSLEQHVMLDRVRECFREFGNPS